VHRYLSSPSTAVRETPVAVLALGVLILICTFLAARGGSSVTWRADYENASLTQWSALQAKDPSRAQVQSSVVRDGQYATRIEVRPGDNNVAGSGSGERTEFMAGQATTGGYEGQEAYWAWSDYFPQGFDAPPGGWNAFTQFHHTGSTGQANVHFAVTDKSRLTLRVMGGSYSSPVRKDFTLAPLQTGRWYDFVFHVKWSANSSVGFVQVWVNGNEVVPKTMTPTIYSGQGVYLKQGYYRSAYSGTTVLYLDGTRKGGSYADVASGFGSSTPPSPTLSVAQSIADGAKLAGTVGWTATPSGKTVSRVRFLVDGTTVGTDTTAPYTTPLDTTALTNATHTFLVEATSTDGTVATASANATVANTATAFAVTQSIRDGSTLAGKVTWNAAVTGKPVSSVEYTIDGRAAGTEHDAPYTITFDSSQFANRAHTFGVVAYATDGTTASSSVVATISNTASAPVSPPPPTSPAPEPAPSLTPAPTTSSKQLAVTQNVKDGQELSGTMTWTAATSGAEASRVVFSVDGNPVSTERYEPYVAFGDRSSFDTRKLSDGRHVLSVRATGTTGETATATASVTVENRASSPAPSAALSVAQNVADGQKLAGTLTWTASPSGAKASRVEFSIDGRLVSTERLAPYVAFGDRGKLDTTKMSNGRHSLSVEAFGADGAKARTVASVVVENGVSAPKEPAPSTPSEPSSSPSPTPTPSSGATSAPAPSSKVVSSIEDGDTLRDEVSWTVDVDGIAVSRIEFFIDGKLAWTERLLPYVFGGDRRTLDTTTLAPGAHTLALRIVSTSGEVTKRELRVTVVR
jgi:hypothetical protein